MTACLVYCFVVVVQLLSHVWLFVTPQTVAHLACMSSTISWSLLKLMSIESVMPSNHLILFHPLTSYPDAFPASGSFLMTQFFSSGGQSIGVSASASVPPMNIQDWLPLGLTGSPCSPRDFLSLQDFKSLLQHHSSKASILQRSVFFIYMLSCWSILRSISFLYISNNAAFNILLQNSLYTTNESFCNSIQP